MNLIQASLENNVLTIILDGRIDSLNAPQIEEEIREARQKFPADSIILDCDKLSVISSAGLRVVLRLKQEIDDTQLINVHPEIYDIFDMTGFTEIMTIRKAYRVLSVNGCEVIGQGANGKVYRIDRETIVKVYLNPEALPEIHRERELARAAFVLGIPTAIPYDVVRIEGGGYGSVFELLNADSFAKLLIRGEKTLDETAKMSIDLLKLIHSKVIKPESMPDMRAVALDWAGFMQDHLPKDQADKLYSLVEAVPEDMHMLHGDYHLKNVMLQNGETLLIDMDTLCHGHPIFELASMYNAYVGFGLLDHSKSEAFIGLNYDILGAFWHKSLELYLGTTDEDTIRSVEDKAKIVGFTRLIRRSIRRGGLETEEGRKEIDLYKTQLSDLLPRTDTLLF